MGDFHQTGMITTLHNIAKRPVEAMEAELNQFKTARPMSWFYRHSIRTYPVMRWALSSTN